MDAKEPQKHLSIKNWAVEDRPREKFLLKGRSALTDAELLAILIGTGSGNLSAVDLAKALLNHAQNDLNNLAVMSVKDLMKVKGIGKAKAVSIAAALEIGRRRKHPDMKDKTVILTSSQVYEHMKPYLTDLDHEEFWVIGFNNSMHITFTEPVGKGGINMIYVDIRLIFKKAIESSCTSIAIVHNHPSGKLTPSGEDKALTQRVKEAGEILSIRLMDHIIYTNNGYYSFRDKNNI